MTSFVGKRCLGEKFARAFLFQTKSVSAIDTKMLTNLTDLKITLLLIGSFRCIISDNYEKIKTGRINIFRCTVHELVHLWQFVIVM